MCNGKTSDFQSDDRSSILLTRSITITEGSNMSTNIDEAMQVSGLGRPDLVLVCTALVRRGLAKSPVDAINKLAEGTLTPDMLEKIEIEIDQEVTEEE